MYGFLRFVMKVCAFFFAIGLLGLVVVTATEIISGTPDEGYPGFTQDAKGRFVGVDYWTYMWQIGLFTVIPGIIGSILFQFVGE